MTKEFKGLVWFVASCFGFSCMTTLVRYLSDFGFNGPSLVFLRNVIAVLMLLPFIYIYRTKLDLTIKYKKFYFWRCFVGVIAMMLMFQSMLDLDVSTVVALSFTTPIFVSVLAVLFLKEKMHIRRWTAVILGFAGAMVVIEPGLEEFNAAFLVCLLASALIAVTLIMVKKLSNKEDAFAMMFYLHVLMAIFPAPLMYFYWVTPTSEQLIAIAGISLSSIFSHYSLVRSYQLTEVTLTTPFDFTRLVMASILAYVFLNEVPNSNAFIGGFIIVASAFYIARREAMLKRRK